MVCVCVCEYAEVPENPERNGQGRENVQPSMQPGVWTIGQAEIGFQSMS
jgi:hypothetical protein